MSAPQHAASDRARLATFIATSSDLAVRISIGERLISTTAPPIPVEYAENCFCSVADFCFQQPRRGAPMIRRRATRRSLVFCGSRDIGIPPTHVRLPLSQHAANFVYTETDNSNPGQNAVIAYRQNSHGQVTEIGSFKTDGTGVANCRGCSDRMIPTRKSSPVLTDVCSSQSIREAIPSPCSASIPTARLRWSIIGRQFRGHAACKPCDCQRPALCRQSRR